MGNQTIINNVTAVQTRPANTTDYTTGDSINGATTAVLTFSNIVTYAGQNGTITRVAVKSTNVAFAGKRIRLWLYNVTPTAVADNSVLPNPCDMVKGAFAIDLTFETAVAGDVEVFAQADVSADFQGIDRNLYGLCQAMEAMTPISGGVTTFCITTEQK